MKISHEGRGRLVSAARKDFYTAPLSPILPEFAVLIHTASNRNQGY